MSLPRIRLLALFVVPCLLSLRAAVAQGGAAGPAPGPAIVAIEVVGDQGIPRETVLETVKDILVVGQPWTPEAAKKASGALLAFRQIYSVDISAQEADQGVKVVIKLDLRPKITKITLAGNTVFSDDVLLGLVWVTVGDPVDYDAIRRDARRISDFYQQPGCMALVPAAQVDADGVLNIVIQERKIEGVEIVGLQRTDEAVVRKLIHTQPGALFRQRQIQGDLRRIFNTGLFQSINTDVRNGEADKTAVIVVVKLEEKPAGAAAAPAAQ